jgi:hypothetical protein
MPQSVRHSFGQTRRCQRGHEGPDVIGIARPPRLSIQTLQQRSICRAIAGSNSELGDQSRRQRNRTAVYPLLAFALGGPGHHHAIGLQVAHKETGHLDRATAGDRQRLEEQTQAGRRGVAG